MGCPNCKCGSKKEEVVNILNIQYDKNKKEFIKSKIVKYHISDYMNESGENLKSVEVVLEDRIIEIDNMNNEINLENIVEYLIDNSLVYID